MLTGIPAREGSLDGYGAADHDRLYTFGRLPSVAAPFPFSTRQFARLLVLRGRIRAELGEAPTRRDSLARPEGLEPPTLSSED